MFEIQELTAGHGTVVDGQRGISLEFVGGRGRIPGMVYALKERDLVVPLEIRRTPHTDAAGQEFYVITFDSFGSLFSTPTGRTFQPVDFRSPEERRRLQLLAAEALLVFGSWYDGLSKPDGFNRVDFAGQTYTLSSLGYEGVSN